MSVAIAGIIVLGIVSIGFQRATAEQSDITGKVVGVVDGDTLDILTPDKRNLRIRLSGIDAPEKKQPFGMDSKKHLSKLAFNCTASIRVINTDRYGRIVGDVHACGSDVNEGMLRAGYAWVYDQYVERSRESEWKALEKKAKAKGKGLWSDPDVEPIEPWLWRKGQR